MFAAGNAVWANAIMETSLLPDTASQQPLEYMPELFIHVQTVRVMEVLLKGHAKERELPQLLKKTSLV